MKSIFSEANINLIKQIFSNLNQTTLEVGNEIGKSIEEYNPQIYEILKNFSENAILPMAIFFLTFVLVINLCNSLLDDRERQNPIKLFLMFAIKSIIAITLVTNSFEITNLILNLSQNIINSALNVLIDNHSIGLSANMDILEEVMKELNFGSLFWIWITLLITTIIVWLIRILVQVVILGRFIEIFLRIALAPIPFATFFNREFSNTGYNFVKSIISISLQAFLILIVIAIYKGVLLTLSVDISTEENLNLFLIKILAINLTLITSLFQTKRISDSIVNAH